MSHLPRNRGRADPDDHIYGEDPTRTRTSNG